MKYLKDLIYIIIKTHQYYFNWDKWHVLFPSVGGKDREKNKKQFVLPKSLIGKEWVLCILSKTPTPWKQIVCTNCSELFCFKNQLL